MPYNPEPYLDQAVTFLELCLRVDSAVGRVAAACVLDLVRGVMGHGCPAFFHLELRPSLRFVRPPAGFYPPHMPKLGIIHCVCL